MLCPYCPHSVIIVLHRSTLLLFLCTYIIIVLSDLIMLWAFRLLYIERRFFHLYHLRIVHLCNVKEVPPQRGWFLIRWLIFSILLWAHFITLGIRVLDSRVSLLQNKSSWNFWYNFLSKTFQMLKKIIYVEISMILGSEFHILSHYIFGDMIQGSYGFCRLQNYILNMWPWETLHNFLFECYIKITLKVIEKGWIVVFYASFSSPKVEVVTLGTSYKFSLLKTCIIRAPLDIGHNTFLKNQFQSD